MAKDPNELINELNKNINSVNNMPEGLGGQINYDLRDAPFQGATQVAHQQTQADLFALQEKRRLQALDAQRKSALANLARERGQVDPAFNTALSNVAGTSARQARNFAEYLAQRGQTQSGIAAQGEMQRHSDLLSQQGQLEQQRTDWLADLGMRESEVRNAYEQSVIDAAMEREYNQLNFLLQDRDRQRQEDIATVGQYGADYARKLNEIEAMEARGDFSQSHLKPYLLMGRQEKLGAIQQAEIEERERQLNELYKTTQLEQAWQKLDIDRLRAMNVGRGGGSSGGSSGGNLPSYSQALNMWNSGIDNPTVRAVLGIDTSQQVGIEQAYNEAYEILQKYGKRSGQWTGKGTNEAVDYLQSLVNSGRLSETNADMVAGKLFKR